MGGDGDVRDKRRIPPQSANIALWRHKNGWEQQWRNHVQKGKNALILMETRLMYLNKDDGLDFCFAE